MDVVGIGKRQRKRLAPAHRHLLIERGQRRAGRRIAAHQVDEVNQVGLPQCCQGTRVGVWTESTRGEELAADLQDDGLGVAHAGDRLPMPYHVDERLIQSNRQRVELVQRPLVRLVVLARRRQDGQLGQPAPEWPGEPEVSARAM